MRSGLEKETIIVFNEVEKSATIHTFNRKIINYLMEIKDVEQDMEFISNNQGDHRFEVPKSWIKVRAKKKLNLTDEERANRKARLSSRKLKHDSNQNKP